LEFSTGSSVNAISRAIRIIRGCIFGRVVSTRQAGENFLHRLLSDMSVDVLVSVI
jgi:hypothetical protein